jgi:hypothetical protein
MGVQNGSHRVTWHFTGMYATLYYPEEHPDKDDKAKLPSKKVV